MRSIPAFLLAFIVTVVISGALMIGCGGGGGGTATTGGASNTGNSNTVAAMTGNNNTASNNNSHPCSKDGEFCNTNENCCDKSSQCIGGVRVDPFLGLYTEPYKCGKPSSNNNCTADWNTCTKGASNCCGTCQVDGQQVRNAALVFGISFSASQADGVTKGYCIPF